MLFKSCGTGKIPLQEAVHVDARVLIQSAACVKHDQSDATVRTQDSKLHCLLQHRVLSRLKHSLRIPNTQELGESVKFANAKQGDIWWSTRGQFVLPDADDPHPCSSNHPHFPSSFTQLERYRNDDLVVEVQRNSQFSDFSVRDSLMMRRACQHQARLDVCACSRVAFQMLIGQFGRRVGCTTTEV